MRKKLFFISIVLIALALAGCDNGTSSESLKTYTVTFDADGGTFNLYGGTPAIIKVTLESHKEIGTLPAQPEKKGYAFGGWWTEKDGQGSLFLEDSFLTDNLTVYADWVNFTITDMPEEYLPYKVYLVESIPQNYDAAIGAITIDTSAKGTLEDGNVIWDDPQQKPLIGTFTVIISNDVGYSILQATNVSLFFNKGSVSFNNFVKFSPYR